MKFNVKLEVENIINFIKNYYSKFNFKGVVIGISGGKDSAVVSGLFSLALGKENVIGLTMPCYSKEEDKNDAKIVANHFGFDLYDIDLTEIFNLFKKKLVNFKNIDDYAYNSDINLKPRLRMNTLYYIASLFSSKYQKGYLVAGCGNKSEKFVGYTTKWGDNASDIEILSDFTVNEVIKIGEYIGVPKKILYKIPNDGLSDMSDEEKLGFTYDEIERVIYNKSIDNDVKNKIIKQHNDNLHKENIVRYKR